MPRRRSDNPNPPADVPPPYEQAVAAAAPDPVPAPALQPVPAPAPIPAPLPQPALKQKRTPLPEDIKTIIICHYVPEFERIVREHEPADLSSTSAEESGKKQKLRAFFDSLEIARSHSEPSTASWRMCQKETFVK